MISLSITVGYNIMFIFQGSRLAIFNWRGQNECPVYLHMGVTARDEEGQESF